MCVEKINLENIRYLMPAHEIVRRSKNTHSLCGVYFLISGGAVVYVGQSRDVHYRLRQHKEKKEFDRVFVIECGAEMLSAVEEAYIEELKPPLNVQKRPFSGGGKRRAYEVIQDFWEKVRAKDDERWRNFFLKPDDAS